MDGTIYSEHSSAIVFPDFLVASFAAQFNGPLCEQLRESLQSSMIFISLVLNKNARLIHEASQVRPLGWVVLHNAACVGCTYSAYDSILPILSAVDLESNSSI